MRTVDGPYASSPGLDTVTDRQYGYRCDISYTFRSERMADVIEEIYPAMVAEIEAAFLAVRSNSTIPISKNGLLSCDLLSEVLKDGVTQSNLVTWTATTTQCQL